MASIDLYTKQQIDAKIPDTSTASSGDVLTFNGTSNEWAPVSGGGGISKHTFTDFGELTQALIDHPDAIGTMLVKTDATGNPAFRFHIEVAYTYNSNNINIFGEYVKYSTGSTNIYNAMISGTISPSSTDTSKSAYCRFREIDSSGTITAWQNVASGNFTVSISDVSLYY